MKLSDLQYKVSQIAFIFITIIIILGLLFLVGFLIYDAFTGWTL